MGNICRSPAAEAIMNSLIKKHGLENQITIDSAGTIDYHIGESADPRMIERAALRDFNITHRARVFDPKVDFDKFDYIITMDNQNYKNILSLSEDKKYRSKIIKLAGFASTHKIEEIPDPYYWEADGFDFVLDVLEDACSGLLRKIEDDIKESGKKQD